MSTRPWLSILVPVYNVAPYVQECVASIMDQWIDGVELLLLDDVSTDNSGALIQALCLRYPGRIRLFHHGLNRGLSAARNSLLAEANGRHVWFLDSDDLLCTGALAALHRILTAHDPDLVLCDFRMLRSRPQLKYWLRGEGHRHSFGGRPRRLFSDREQLITGLLTTAQLHVWTKIARREAWLRAPFPEDRCFEDIAVMPGLLQATTSVYYEPTPWVAYRQRDDSIMHTFSEKKVQDLLFSLAQLRGGLLEKFPSMGVAARFALDQFCLKSVAASARRSSREAQARKPELLRMYRESLARLFPQGIEPVLVRYRQRGWRLRAARIGKTLRQSGII
ncbi:MAG: glycosyltransferase family 2 protein [Thermomonas sp.]